MKKISIRLKEYNEYGSGYSELQIRLNGEWFFVEQFDNGVARGNRTASILFKRLKEANQSPVQVIIERTDELTYSANPPTGIVG